MPAGPWPGGQQLSGLGMMAATGSTQLIVDTRLRQEDRDELEKGGASLAVETLLRGGGLDQDMLVQVNDEVAVVREQRVLAVLNTTTSPGIVPHLAGLRPLCVEEGVQHRLLLCGRNISQPEDLLLARQHGRDLSVEFHRTGLTRASGAEWVQVQVLGAATGCVELEARRGLILSAARPLLVLPCPAAVAEVRQLEANHSGVTDVGALLRDVGLVAQYLHRERLAAAGTPLPRYSPNLLASIADLAQRVVAFATARGWVAVVRLLLPAVAADGCTAEAALAAMDALCPDGASLLHVAVGTASTALVEALAGWAHEAGGRWAVDARGALGVTPLHVAALLPGWEAMRRALTEMDPATVKLWSLVQADDGSTPEAFAQAHAAAQRQPDPRLGSLPSAPLPAVPEVEEEGMGAEQEARVPEEKAVAKEAGASASASAAAPPAAARTPAAVAAAVAVAAVLDSDEEAEWEEARAMAQDAEEARLMAEAGRWRQVVKTKLDGLFINAILHDIGPDPGDHAPAAAACGPPAAVRLGAALVSGAGAAALLYHAWSSNVPA